MKTIKIATFVALALLVASCCSCRTKTRGAGSLTGNSWQLIQIEGESFNARGSNYVLDFASDNRLSGKGDCNRLMGGYESDAATGKLTFNGTASTRMLCPDQEGESRFIRVLDSVDGYRVDGETLMLQRGGETVLVFKKASNAVI